MDYNLFGYLTDNIIQYYINKIKGTDLIITFIDSTYLPIFNIFYTYFERFNLKNLLVISLDDKVFLNLSKRKIFTLLIKYKIVKKNSFWDFRYNIINKLFQLSKKNIIHTDSDCIWLKNITKNPQLSLKYDIIGQMAFGLPKNVVNKIGMVLCCGFYKISSFHYYFCLVLFYKIGFYQSISLNPTKNTSSDYSSIKPQDWLLFLHLDPRYPHSRGIAPRLMP